MKKRDKSQHRLYTSKYEDLCQQEKYMEEEYWAECEACEVETQVLVLDNEETPQYCSMCGSPLEYELMEDED